MQKVIISVIGQDRPGIIAAVTRILFDLDFNIENISQTILQAQFSGIFIASTTGNMSLASLEKYLRKDLDAMKLSVFIKELDSIRTPQAFVCEPFVITTKGPDRKGLVAHITAIMARYNVNVTNFQALFKGGDDPNANIMIYEVDIPVSIDHKKLQEELHQKATQLNLDLSIIHKNIFEAINRI
ncbi:MAG: ACT domain-containing protein [Desulfobacteraceae bacterium]|jgi:glycine cleavage system transcriptional repressor